MNRPGFLQFPLSSSSVADGYFAAQALNAGYLDIAGDIRRAELAGEAGSARGILERELLKEKIRGEIILRELARAKLLEEEVGKQIEMERALAMRRQQTVLVSAFGSTPEVSEEGALLTHFVPKVGFEKRMVVTSEGMGRSDREKLFSERMVGEILPPNVPRIDHGKKSCVSAFSPNAESSKAGSGGIKRRASELPAKKLGAPAERDWTCALCRVSATSKESLNEHLHGRKHKVNAELMGIIKNVEDSTSAKRADRLLNVTQTMEQKESQSNIKGKHPFIEATRLCPPLKKKTARFWCDLCTVECSSSSVLAAHLGGKRHRTELEKSELVVTKVAAGKTTVVEIESSKAGNSEKAKSPSTDEGTGMVEKL